MVRHTGEDFINVECVAVTTMLPLQFSSVYSSEFDAQPDGFLADGDVCMHSSPDYLISAI